MGFSKLTHLLEHEDPSIQQSVTPAQDWLQVRLCNQRRKIFHYFQTYYIFFIEYGLYYTLTHCRAHLPSFSDGWRP